LVEERDHPFQFGDARSRRLAEIHRDYMAMPLLHLLRSVGFADAMDWLREAGLDSRLPAQLPDEVCQICELFCRDRKIASYLLEMTNEPTMQLKIAILAYHTLNEQKMLQSVLERFEPIADRIPGYADARSMIEATYPLTSTGRPYVA
jgi:hypothetical protein